MANLSRTTQDHDEIRRWAEERGGKPAHVKSTESSDDIGIIRIDFPGFSGEGSLEEISWNEFFEKFDNNNLALIYQEETAEGEKSNFNKLVKAETAAAAESRGGGSSSGSSQTSTAQKSASSSSSKKSASGGAAKKSSPAKSASKSAPAKKAAPS